MYGMQWLVVKDYELNQTEESTSTIHCNCLVFQLGVQDSEDFHSERLFSCLAYRFNRSFRVGESNTVYTRIALKHPVMQSRLLYVRCVLSPQIRNENTNFKIPALLASNRELAHISAMGLVTRSCEIVAPDRTCSVLCIVPMIEISNASDTSTCN